MRVRMPIAWRMFLGTALVVAAVLGGSLLLTARAAQRAAAAAAERGIAAIRAQVSTQLDARARGLLDAARVFAQIPEFRSLIANGSPADAADQAREAAERLGAGWVQLTDARGVRLAKSDEPNARADALGGTALIRRALEGEATAAYGRAGDTLLFNAVAVPIEGPTPGRLAGTLMAVQPLDAAAARALGAAAGGDVVLYVQPPGDTAGVREPRIVASTLPDAPALRTPIATLASAAVRGAPATTLRVGNDAYYGLATPLRSADGRVLGGVAVLHAQAAELRPFRELERTILLAGFAGLTLALGVSLSMARQVTRPLSRLVVATRRAASGDYTGDVRVRPGDELGDLAEAFQAMLTDLREKQVLVEFARLTPRGAHTPRPSPATGVARIDVGAGAPVDAPTLRTVHGASAATLAPNEPAARPLDAFAAAAALRPGQRFADRYVIRHMIGAGGVGVVFLAIDTRDGDAVALKVLRPDVRLEDPISVSRLEREVDLARRLAHPNVVRVYELGEADGLHYLTMEYVEGPTLRQILAERGTLPVPAVLTLGRQLCRALGHAHQHGVVHRDVKPHNLVVTPAGLLKVMDFGTARPVGASRGLTESGALFGTPAYMAPELLRGGAVDARADVYAAGVVLFEALVGRPPFTGADSRRRWKRRRRTRARSTRRCRARWPTWCCARWRRIRRTARRAPTSWRTCSPRPPRSR